MVIKKAAFVTSLERYGNYPGIGLPEIAVAGKSNVGKSSMINKLCMRNKLAKVSATPGKTRLLNVFEINGGTGDAFHLIDLPGYYENQLQCSAISNSNNEIKSLLKNCGFAYLEQIIMHLRNGGKINGTGLC